METATFRILGQFLNQMRHRMPHLRKIYTKILLQLSQVKFNLPLYKVWRHNIRRGDIAPLFLNVDTRCR